MPSKKVSSPDKILWFKLFVLKLTNPVYDYKQVLKFHGWMVDKLIFF